LSHSRSSRPCPFYSDNRSGQNNTQIHRDLGRRICNWGECLRPSRHGCCNLWDHKILQEEARNSSHCSHCCNSMNNDLLLDTGNANRLLHHRTLSLVEGCFPFASTVLSASRIMGCVETVKVRGFRPFSAVTLATAMHARVLRSCATSPTEAGTCEIVWRVWLRPPRRRYPMRGMLSLGEAKLDVNRTMANV